MPVEASDSVLATRVLSHFKRTGRKGSNATGEETKAAETALLLLAQRYPNILSNPSIGISTLIALARKKEVSESQVTANMGPGVRDMYHQIQKDDPKQARSFLIQEMMSSLKLMSEILSNVSKTRSEISMTFARNARA
jgi:hypothetical protein